MRITKEEYHKLKKEGRIRKEILNASREKLIYYGGKNKYLASTAVVKEI